MTVQRILYTERVQLRPFEEGDFKYLKDAMTDPDVMRFTSFGTPQPEPEIKKSLQDAMNDLNPPFGVRCAMDRNSGDFIGWFMLKVSQRKHPELGYMLVKEKWGLGYATEIALALIRYGFEKAELDHIIALVHKDNLASISVLKKVKMSEIQKPSNIKEKDLLVFKINRDSFLKS